jgi:hypothetical protein
MATLYLLRYSVSQEIYPEHNVLESLRVTENLCGKCMYRIGIGGMSCTCFVAVPLGYPSSFTVTYKLLWIHPP